MKKTLTILLAAIFLYLSGAGSIRAQTNAAAETGASNPPVLNNEAPAAVSYADRQSSEFEAKKIEAEKDMLSRKLDFGRSVIHYIAAYSWVLLVLAFFYFRFRRRKLMHETLRLMIEKGMPINPELVESIKDLHERRGLRGDFRAGLILVAVGIGVMIIAGKSGLIILIIGVAFLTMGFLEEILSKKDKNGQPPKS